MRRLFPLACMLAAALWPIAPVRAQDAAHVTDVVKIEGIIDARVAELIERRLDDASDGGLVVLQIDSPGTLGVNVSGLANRISASHVPVVVWAGPPGSLVQGGAVSLLAHAHIAVTSPRSGIGPALPLDLGNENPPCINFRGAPPDRQDADDLVRCAELSAASEAAGYAEIQGRDPEAIRALFERRARALTPQESLDLDVVDMVAQSIPGLLNELDGREIETLGGTQELVTEGGAERFQLRFSELGPIERVLHAVGNPSASYILLVLGLWAVAFELVQPGFGLAGFTGILFVALAVYSLTILPVGWLGLGLIVAGTGLFVMDVRLRTLGLLTLLGAVAFGFGSFLIYGRVSDRIAISPWVLWSFIVGSVVYFGFALTAAVRSRERAVAQHQSGLVGLVGEAASDLAPEGQVVVKGAMWQGRSLSGPIPGGAKVRVRNVDGLILEVSAEG